MNIVASFWVRETKEGEKFLAGLTKEGKRFLCFKNKKKTEQKHPDWLLYDTGEFAGKKSGDTPVSDNSVNQAKDFS
jgi:hypothetical protein